MGLKYLSNPLDPDSLLNKDYKFKTKMNIDHVLEGLQDRIDKIAFEYQKDKAEKLLKEQLKHKKNNMSYEKKSKSK